MPNSKKSWYPNVKLVRAFYRGFNERIFDGKLPENIEIIVSATISDQGAYGGVVPAYGKHKRIQLWIAPYIPVFDMFVAVLGHEMVHIYQQITEGKMHHGNSFKKWSPKIRQFCKSPVY